jgi:DNA repair protein RadA/Sms
LRLKEAAKLGFEEAWVPGGVEAKGIRVARFGQLRQLVERVVGR